MTDPLDSADPLVRTEREIEKALNVLDAECYAVDVHEKYKRDAPVIAIVVDRSTAMSGLLFVRQALHGLAQEVRDLRVDQQVALQDPAEQRAERFALEAVSLTERLIAADAHREAQTVALRLLVTEMREDLRFSDEVAKGGGHWIRTPVYNTIKRWVDRLDTLIGGDKEIR